MAGLQIQRDVSLKPYNSMAVDAQASHLVIVNNKTELQQALSYAARYKLRPLILGEGSNTLFRSDFPGLIVCNRIKGIDVIEERPEGVLVKLGAGENWHQWVKQSLSRGWYGHQNLALIPGLVGAAPIQNIGAYGAELSDTLSAVEYLDIEQGTQHSLTNAECRFAYRDSIFKGALAGRAAITAVSFRLSRKPQPDISYPALRQYFADRLAPTAEDVFTAVCEIRQRKIPLPAQIPNTGSFFKNPIVSKAEFERVRSTHPDVVSFQHGDQIKLAAGWLIEQAGWKQRSQDGVGVHPDQALVIVNPSGANGRQVLEFAARIQRDIEQKFSIRLEIEPRIY